MEKKRTAVKEPVRADAVGDVVNLAVRKDDLQGGIPVVALVGKVEKGDVVHSDLFDAVDSAVGAADPAPVLCSFSLLWEGLWMVNTGVGYNKMSSHTRARQD